MTISLDAEKKTLIQQLNNEKHSNEQKERHIQALQRDMESVNNKNR